MTKLSEKQLETNEYILNKIELHPKNTFTTDKLVELGIFSSNGWAHCRRKHKLLPNYIQYGPKMTVNYEKEQILEWIKSEIKAKSYLLKVWNRNLSIFEEKKSKKSPGRIETESMRQKRKLLPNNDPCGPRVEDTKSEISYPCPTNKDSENHTPVPMRKDNCKKLSDVVYYRLCQCILEIIQDDKKLSRSNKLSTIVYSRLANCIIDIIIDESISENHFSQELVRDRIYEKTGYIAVP